MSIVARKYAKILLSKAENKSQKLLQKEQLYLLCDLMSSNKQFLRFLKSPIVKDKEKIKILDEIFSDKKITLENMVKNLLYILVLDKKIDNITKIAYYYNKSMLKEENIVHAKAKFASDPSAEDLISLKKLINNKFNLEIDVEYKVDKKLISGFIVDFDGKRYDASLINIIEKLG